MRKPEVYVILEEIIENGRSFFDVDIQVLDGSASNRKTRYNSLEKARDAVETEIKGEFDVLTIQELLKPKEPKSEGKKNYKQDVFLPKCTVYEIDFNLFKEELDEYLKQVRNWNIPYTLSFEESDDEGQKGELYFFVDIDSLQEEELEALEKEYNDNIAFIDFLQIFLEDMFETKYLDYEFNAFSEELIVTVSIVD